MASGWAWTFCFLLSLQGIVASYNFTVGGDKGWHVPPRSDSYNLWAEKNRFQIGDSLLFKYDRNVDSVLQVGCENYETCNTTNPINLFQDGNTNFKFTNHSRFCFISGNFSNCKKGEKLIVVVLAPCHNGQGPNCKHSSSPNTSPTISPSPKTSPSPSPSPNTSPSPKSSPSPSTSNAFTPTQISHPSLSPTPSTSSSPPSSFPAESPEIIAPSSSSSLLQPGTVQSVSSSSATSLVNLVIPVLLVALLKPNL